MEGLGGMASKLPKPGSQPPPPRKHSEVRPSLRDGDERRAAERWVSDAHVEILSPLEVEAEALDVSSTGMQVVLDGWLSTGTLLDVRITARSGRAILKRARVIWARRVGHECVAGLNFVGSIAPPPPGE
jgi:hypothetical protein